MTTLTRDAIFISHANPEDNEFTVWLGARLTAAGHEVWADVLRLRGGQDWQRLLEDARAGRSGPNTEFLTLPTCGTRSDRAPIPSPSPEPALGGRHHLRA